LTFRSGRSPQRGGFEIQQQALDLGSDLNGFAAVNRGGNWNNGTNAGLGTTNLNNGPGNRNVNIGFRSAAL